MKHKAPGDKPGAFYVGRIVTRKKCKLLKELKNIKPRVTSPGLFMLGGL